MTAVREQKTKLVSQLISSCYQAQDGYRSAARVVEDLTLRRLFELYAQQRIRFAQELREYMPLEDESSPTTETPTDLFTDRRTVTGKDSIRQCLEIDARTLTLYKEALAYRALPSRAHFLISSQLALMQRVHDRMDLMLREPAGVPTPQAMMRVSA